MYKKILITIVVLIALAVTYSALNKNAPEGVETTLVGKEDLLIVTEPRPEENVTLPFVVKGEARGYWFFEGSFPVTIKDTDGNILHQTFASASSEWMTEDFVPYESEVSFAPPEYIDHIILVLEKDNPSGMPEFDDSFEITLFLK